MNLSLNILLDQLRDIHCESHVPFPCLETFSSAALLPRNYQSMRHDLIHICRLSDALRASAVCPGMYYLCIRDRIQDTSETEEMVQGMVIINENMDVELLFSMVQDIFVRINSWYQNMQDALIHEQSLQHIVDLSQTVIGNTINISDSAFTLLARTQDIETDDELSLLLAEFGYHPESTLQKFRELHRLEVYASAQAFVINDNRQLSKYIMVSKVFRFRNTYFTHVVMVCDHHPLSDGLLELFQLLTDILAIYAERNWKDKNALSHNYDSFIFDLLNGTLTKPNDISERAKYLGLNISGQMALVKISVPQGMEAALGRVGRELTDLLPGTQVVLYQQAVLALVHLRGTRGELGIPREQMDQFLGRHQARGGMSNPFVGAEHVPEAYTQASLALKYNAEMKGGHFLEGTEDISKLPVLCPFGDRVLHSLLGEHTENEAIWRGSVYHDALKTLYDHDRQHNTNNLQLLRVYLWYERKATETGEVLHMHRNNVIYRIGRIESMMGLDLNDYRTRLGIQISFLLLELFGFPSG